MRFALILFIAAALTGCSFSPDEPANGGGDVQVDGDVNEDGDVTVEVNVYESGDCQLILTPPNAHFSAEGTYDSELELWDWGTDVRAVTVFNDCSEEDAPTLSLDFYVSGPDSDYFELDSYYLTLTPGSSAVVYVTFSPDAVGDFDAAFNANSTEISAASALTGEGVEVEPEVIVEEDELVCNEWAAEWWIEGVGAFWFESVRIEWTEDTSDFYSRSSTLGNLWCLPVEGWAAGDLTVTVGVDDVLLEDFDGSLGCYQETGWENYLVVEGHCSNWVPATSDGE